MGVGTIETYVCLTGTAADYPLSIMMRVLGAVAASLGGVITAHRRCDHVSGHCTRVCLRMRQAGVTGQTGL
jgi:hypothetical protein